MLTLTVRDMQILPLIPNMDSGITGAAGVPPEEKPLEEWRREQFAIKLLEALGISFCTYTKAIGPAEITEFHPEEIENNAFYMPDKKAAEKAGAYLEQCMKEQDSAGGIIECRIKGVPPGLGTPVFEKLDAMLAQAVMSIGAVKGVEIGEGFYVAQMRGSQDNDGFAASEKGIVKTSNHAGGIMGGISDGSEILLRGSC